MNRSHITLLVLSYEITLILFLVEVWPSYLASVFPSTCLGFLAAFVSMGLLIYLTLIVNPLLKKPLLRIFGLEEELEETNEKQN